MFEKLSGAVPSKFKFKRFFKCEQEENFELEKFVNINKKIIKNE